MSAAEFVGSFYHLDAAEEETCSKPGAAALQQFGYFV